MKKKAISFKGKLTLNKETVATLDSKQQNAVAGGATYTNPGCGGSNHCTIPFPTIKEERCRYETKTCK